MSENNDKIKFMVNQRNSIEKKVKRLYDVAAQANTEVASEKAKKDFFVRYESLFDDVIKFESLHLEIVGLIADDQVDEHDKVQDTFTDLQFTIKSIYRDLFEDQTHVKESQSSVKSEASVNGYRCNRVRLPKIEIPKFDGDYKKWPTFFDMFRSLIHECSSLTNIERFQFLVSYLEKDAAAVVKNIPITDINYETAYNALVKRYQNENFSNRLLVVSLSSTSCKIKIIF